MSEEKICYLCEKSFTRQDHLKHHVENLICKKKEIRMYKL